MPGEIRWRFVKLQEQGVDPAACKYPTGTPFTEAGLPVPNDPQNALFTFDDAKDFCAKAFDCRHIQDENCNMMMQDGWNNMFAKYDPGAPDNAVDVVEYRTCPYGTAHALQDIFGGTSTHCGIMKSKSTLLTL